MLVVLHLQKDTDSKLRSTLFIDYFFFLKITRKIITLKEKKNDMVRVTLS